MIPLVESLSRIIDPTVWILTDDPPRGMTPTDREMLERCRTLSLRKADACIRRVLAAMCEHAPKDSPRDLARLAAWRSMTPHERVGDWLGSVIHADLDAFSAEHLKSGQVDEDGADTEGMN